MTQEVSLAVLDAVARAGELVERSGTNQQPELLVEAVAELRVALLEPMPAKQRAIIEHELGTIFCLLAQTKGEAVAALPLLDRAIRHFNAALGGLGAGERAVAMIEANLAIAHLTRHGWTGAAADLMSCHIALDSAAEGFSALGERGWMDWIEDIRTHLQAAQKAR